MNAPFQPQTVTAEAGLSVFAFFHLNLAFSSIAEERRGEVIQRCYWPLLGLAEHWLRPAPPALAAGQVVLFRLNGLPLPKHCAIIVGPDRFIHASPEGAAA